MRWTTKQLAWSLLFVPLILGMEGEPTCTVESGGGGFGQPAMNQGFADAPGAPAVNSGFEGVASGDVGEGFEGVGLGGEVEGGFGGGFGGGGGFCGTFFNFVFKAIDCILLFDIDLLDQLRGGEGQGNAGSAPPRDFGEGGPAQGPGDGEGSLREQLRAARREIRAIKPKICAEIDQALAQAPFVNQAVVGALTTCMNRLSALSCRDLFGPHSAAMDMCPELAALTGGGGDEGNRAFELESEIEERAFQLAAEAIEEAAKR